jgi:hypothetical protein
MNKLLIVVFAVILLFSFAVSVCADTEAVSETAEVEKAPENNGALMKNMQIFMLVGAVVGALVLVAFMYKKKDEARYL